MLGIKWAAAQRVARPPVCYGRSRTSATTVSCFREESRTQDQISHIWLYR